MNVVVFTAAIGATDPLRAPAIVDPAVRYLCFSDRRCRVPPYEWIPVASSPTPRLAARRLKILADHPLLAAADATVWHDAAYQLSRALAWVARRLSGADLVALRHPRRCTIEAEAVAIARYGYVPLDVAHAHVARYRAAGFADHVLTCTGLLARRVSDPMRAFNQAWWDETQQWGGRDQGSVDFAAWQAGIDIAHAKGTIRNNVFACWREAA
jgi:hypothetical protein